MRTPKEWATLFSESLTSTNPVTMEYIITQATNEARSNARKELFEQIDKCLKGHPYYFQPEIVEDIINHIKLQW